MSGFEEIAAAIAAATETAAATAPEAEAALGGIDAMQAAGLGGMGAAQNGIGAGSFGALATGLLNNPASAMSSQGLPAQIARGLLSGGGGKGSTALMAQMGMGLMNPQHPPPPQPGRPMGGGQPAPMTAPYGNPGPFGQGGNSMNGPPPGMSMEEWLKRKQMMMGRMQ